jgi:hypothetical protein
VTDTGFPASCYNCYNYSFLSWTGVGLGSWNTTNPNGTTFLGGPVNETANFAFLSGCSFGTCTNASYNYTFNEVGLPAGTDWTVSFSNLTSSSAGSSISFLDGAGPFAFTVWTVPDGASQSWVGTPSVPSPITSLQGATETVRFALVSDAAIPSLISFGATGLPSGVTSWGLTVNGTGYGVGLENATLDLGSGNRTLNATAVYGPNQVGGYLSGFRIDPEVVNSTPYTVAPGATVTFAGPAIVTALYAPEYWVTVSASLGGNVTPASVGWTDSGVSVNLTATAATGYAFLEWTGTGAGSVSLTTSSITVAPTGPVTELASFVPVVPTYTVRVLASGLLPGIPVTLTLGNQTYSEVAPFNVTGLVHGTYSIAVPTIYPNGTYGVRYDPSSVSSTLPYSAGALTVATNGSVTLAYLASYALTVAPTVNGTVSPTPGAYWESASAPVTLTGTPALGHSFSAWIGIGPGAVSAATPSITLTLTGPVTESAYFVTNPPIPPATYSLTLTETGLPAGATWSASAGSNGVAGAGTLVISALNGSYTVAVPIVSGATGVRYVPSDNGSFSVQANQDRTLNVTFTTQFALTVSVSAGGTATPGTEWVDSGTSVALDAVANSSASTFVNWSGSGTGSYTGTSASATLTMSNPVSELATFVPSASLQPKSSSSGGGGSWALPIGLLVVLLIVGLVVGLLVGRGRPPASSGPVAESESDAGTTNPPPMSGAESSGTSSDPPAAGGPADEDSIYGGGGPG